MQLDEEAKEKSALVTSFGLWHFNVMPFGLCNALATFECLMDRILAGLPPTVGMVYLDDILVPAATFQQQSVNLLSVFHRLREAKLNKCCLFQQKVKYLVHIISKEEISTDPD